MRQVPGLAAVALLQSGEHELRAHRAVAQQRAAPDHILQTLFHDSPVTRRYWHAGSEQFSHGTTSVSRRTPSVFRVRPNTASSDFFGRSAPLSKASRFPGKFPTPWNSPRRRDCSAMSHSG